jgi:diguanylate cyclase (GGDEF)-like protein
MQPSRLRAPVEESRPKPRVLVADDQEMIRLLARQSLQVAGFEVHDAVDGAEAVEKFFAAVPDVVLLDVQMPHKDGFEACRELRASRLGQHTPILMMTGLDDVESIEQAYRVGATDFVNKPVNWLILGHRLEYMLRNSSAEGRLRESEARLAHAQRIAHLGYWDWRIDRGSFFCSNELRQILNLPDDVDPESPDDLFTCVHQADVERLQETLQDLLAGHPVADFEFQLAGDGREERFVRQHAEPTFKDDGSVTRISVTLQDVTERRRAEEKVRYMAYYDGLTGLPNRRSFIETLDRRLADTNPSREVSAVLFIEVDRLAVVNESLGHHAGDLLLQSAAERILGCVRTEDVVAGPQLGDPNRLVSRLEGGQFVILLSQLRRLEMSAVIAERLLQALSQPFKIEGHEVFVGASIGVGVFPHDGDSALQLLRNAHLAAEHSKASEESSFKYYAESMNDSARRRLSLEADLRRALEREELELHFQPQFDVETDLIVGAEALLRWRHSEHGMVRPDHFIPICEQTGLIHEIGEWVIREACYTAGTWQTKVGHDLRVAVNISIRQFQRGRLPAIVKSALHNSSLEAGQLELELTESLLLEADDNTLGQLEELRSLGLQLAIDDFGTGYSSLSYLSRMPVDALKVDRSFIRDLPDRKDQEAIARAVIAMGRSLGLRVIAEGVETEAQLEFLRRQRCHEQQGFLCGRPMSADDFAELLLAPEERPAASG